MVGVVVALACYFNPNEFLVIVYVVEILREIYTSLDWTDSRSLIPA